jgi:hypothetical protein
MTRPIPVTEFCYEWSWELGKWVEQYPITIDYDALDAFLGDVVLKQGADLTLRAKNKRG